MNDSLIQEARQHFNEPVLIGFELCRCIGYAEDDEDCYLVVRGQGGRIMWHSCVGGYVFLDYLKGQDDWDRLDSLLELNGAPKEPEVICRIDSGNQTNESA